MNWPSAISSTISAILASSLSLALSTRSLPDSVFINSASMRSRHTSLWLLIADPPIWTWSHPGHLSNCVAEFLEVFGLQSCSSWYNWGCNWVCLSILDVGLSKTDSNWGRLCSFQDIFPICHLHCSDAFGIIGLLIRQSADGSTRENSFTRRHQIFNGFAIDSNKIPRAQLCVHLISVVLVGCEFESNLFTKSSHWLIAPVACYPLMRCSACGMNLASEDCICGP